MAPYPCTYEHVEQTIRPFYKVAEVKSGKGFEIETEHSSLIYEIPFRKPVSQKNWWPDSVIPIGAVSDFSTEMVDELFLLAQSINNWLEVKTVAAEHHPMFVSTPYSPVFLAKDFTTKEDGNYSIQHLISVLFDIAHTLGVNSGFNALFKENNASCAVRRSRKVCIITNTKIEFEINSLLGARFVMASHDKRFVDKILIGLSTDTGFTPPEILSNPDVCSKMGKANPLEFGYLAYTQNPKAVEKGQVTFFPQYRFISNIPVLGMINLK